jgi:hypothetical protein
MNRRTCGAALLVGVLVSGCARGSSQDKGTGKSLLKPTFEPDTSSVESTTSSAPGQAGASSTTSPTSASGGRTTTSSPSATATANTVTVAIADRRGDLTASPLDPPPAWADLIGATMIRRVEGFELRIGLGGGTAPSTTDEDHTMNVASFYDVDGDGTVDYEIWANLASRGWGSSYFDNDGRRGGFQERSGVTVTAEGAEVVLRFPASHLGGFERFRWSIASEWGRYEVLGTAATARDDAPDNDGAARFPG